MNAVRETPAALLGFAEAHARIGQSLPGGSSWQARRKQALALLMELGLPTRRDEAWKYAPLRLLEREQFEPARVDGRPDAAMRESIESGALAIPAARRLTFLDGRFQPALSDEPATIDDVHLSLLADELNADPAALLERIPAAGERAEDRLALLNEAFLSEGVEVRVAPGATPAPLQLQFITHSAARSRHPRVLIEVGSGAHLQLIEQHIGRSPGAAMTNGITNIVLRSGAVLEHYLLVDPSPQDLSLHGTYVEQLADSRLVHHRVLMGGQLARASLQLRLAERGAGIELNSLALALDGGYVDAHSVLNHCAPATRSVERFRAAAGQSGHCVFNGRVHVHAGAPGSDSSQSSRGLLLAPGAEIDARPQLEIYTDDVKCSHGSTTGTLDEDMLFYLLSRGIDSATARGLLIFAFLDDVVARMGIDAVRRHLEGRMATMLPDAPVIREFL